MVEQTEVASKIQEELVAWSEMLRNGVLDASTFVKEQAPGIFQEKLSFLFWSNLIGFVGSILILAICGWTIYRGVKKYNSSYGNAGVAQSIIGSGVAFFFAIFTMCNGYNLLLVITAPRVVMLEYISKLITGGGCG